MVYACTLYSEGSFNTVFGSLVLRNSSKINGWYVFEKEEQ